MKENSEEHKFAISEYLKVQAKIEVWGTEKENHKYLKEWPNIPHRGKRASSLPRRSRERPGGGGNPSASGQAPLLSSPPSSPPPGRVGGKAAWRRQRRGPSSLPGLPARDAGRAS